MSIASRLQALGIALPPVAVPAAAYVPFVRTGNLVFLSGHIAKQDGKPWVGQLGLTMGTDDGKAAARAIAIDPAVAFGRPIVQRAGISTAAIADRLDAGESVEALAEDYDLSRDEIEQAVLYARAA